MSNPKKIMTTIAKWAFLVVITVFSIFPVIYILLGSFKSNSELMTGGNILPRNWILSNYSEAWTKANFALYTWNSIVFCVLVTIGALIISSMAGYCIQRKSFPLRGLLRGTYYATMFIALGAVIYRPLFLMMVDVGLNKSIWSIVMIQIGAQGANIFLVEKFVKNISPELDEAAKIDGCTTFRIYWNIILPLIRPILGVVGLFAFKESWNAYILPSIFTIANKSMTTLTVGVVSLKYADSTAVQWNIMVAGASMAIVPMLLVYIAANKQFIQGLTAGSVKG